jgi:Double zinc ribbon
MTELYDKLKETAGQVISEVDKGGTIQAAISGLRQRMADADRNRRRSQIKQQIQTLKAQEAQAITALSAQVLALYEAGTLTQPELVSLCRNVGELRAQIRVQQAELDLLQPPTPAAPTGGGEGSGSRCPHCGVAVISGAAFCQSCGGRLEARSAPVRFCTGCGSSLREGARFCPTCGQTVPAAGQGT